MKMRLNDVDLVVRKQVSMFEGENRREQLAIDPAGSAVNESRDVIDGNDHIDTEETSQTVANNT